ncbi:MAG: hypothetical protein RIB46_01300 [Pseudomonadales bacterium]
MPGTIYIGHPLDIYVPGMAACVDGALASVACRPEWAEWSHNVRCYDNSNGLIVNDLVSAVLQRTGPVLLINPVQTPVIGLLRQKVGHLVVLQVADAYDQPSLIDALCQTKSMHDSGEPQLPRKLVGAILLVYKLAKERMWGGTRQKNFMWADRLPKGRGFDERYADLLPALINDLMSEKILQSKVSNGKKKYALTPDHMDRIIRALTEHDFGGRLQEILGKDTNTVSCRELDDVTGNVVSHDRDST